MATLDGTHQPFKGILLMLVATFLFSGHDALSKYLCGFYPIMLVIWVRYLCHTLLMVGIFLPRTGLRVLRTNNLRWQALRACSLLATSLFFITSLQYIPLAEATAVNFLAPLMVAALSVPLLKEHVSRGQWIAVLTGFLGVMIIVHPGGELFTPAILLPLCSATCFSFYQILTRKLSETDSPTTSNFYAGIFCTLIMSCIVPFFWQVPTLLHALMMVALGGFGMSAHLLMTDAFRHAAPALLAPFSYSQIVFAGLLGFVLFGHVPAPTTLLGISVICLSGVAAAWLQRRRPAVMISPEASAPYEAPSGTTRSAQ